MTEMTDTSLEALASMGHLVQAIREDIFTAIESQGGLTCDELEFQKGLRHQTASARICELRQQGRIKDSGLRRETRSGRNAIVWRVVE